jgi:predicted GNAT family N-acyltransferase
MHYRCVLCKTQKEIVDNIHVRQEVFVKELEIPMHIESNIYDTTADLFIVYNEHDLPIGAGRFRLSNGIGIIERISVIKNYRNQGIGELLMRTIEDHALKLGIEEIQLGAQLRAFSFYKRLKYEPFGEMYFEVGIEHKKMRKKIFK